MTLFKNSNSLHYSGLNDSLYLFFLRPTKATSSSAWTSSKNHFSGRGSQFGISIIPSGRLSILQSFSFYKISNISWLFEGTTASAGLHRRQQLLLAYRGNTRFNSSIEEIPISAGLQRRYQLQMSGGESSFSWPMPIAASVGL